RWWGGGGSGFAEDASGRGPPDSGAVTGGRCPDPRRCRQWGLCPPPRPLLLLLLPLLWPGKEKVRQRDTSTPVTMETIAVIGCGHWGRNLVRNFAGLAVIRATWDSDRLSWPRSRKNFQVSPLPILPRGLEGRRDS